MQDLDADDESLVKYKQALLGQTSGVLGEGVRVSDQTSADLCPFGVFVTTVSAGSVCERVKRR